MRHLRNIAILLLLLNTLSAPFAQDASPAAGSLAELLAALRNPDGDIRSKAAIALGNLGEAGAAAVPHLTAALGDESEKVRANAAWALARMGAAANAAIPALTRALADESWHVRGRSAVALGARGPAAAAAAGVLQQAMGDEHPGVRAAAAGALWSVTGDADRSRPALSAMLEDADAEARIQAVQAIARVGPAASDLASALAGLLTSDGDVGVRAAAAGALGTVGKIEADTCEILTEALEFEEDQRVREALKAALHSFDTRSGIAAAGPGAVPQPRVPSLEKPTTGPEPPVREPPSRTPTARDLPEGRVPAERQPADRGASAVQERPGTELELLAPRKRGPGPGDVPVAPPTEPIHDGRTLSEWIERLDSRDAGQRAQAAAALGEMGANALIAVGPLNRMRLYDDHEMARLEAARALARILGVPLGDMPPGAKVSGAKGPAPSPPQGLLFYLNYMHDASEEGLILRPEMLIDEGRTYERMLFGMTNLYYLDIAEAHKYRQDARRRGLNVNKRLGELLKEDPQADQPSILPGSEQARSLRARLFKPYKRDHIVRISCNQRTIYNYYRWVDGKSVVHHGGGEHFPMTPAKHNVEITIWTQEGFRLDFSLPTIFRIDLRDAGHSRVLSPTEIGQRHRRELAGLVPSDPHYDLKRGKLLWEILREFPQYVRSLREGQPVFPDDLLPYYREEFLLAKELLNVRPDQFDLLARLVRTLARELITADAVALAHEIASDLVRFAESRALTRNQAERAHTSCAVAFEELARGVIAHSMDIDAYHSLLERALLHREAASRLRQGGPWEHTAQARIEAPQRGWWSPLWDEKRPVQFAELVGAPGEAAERPAEPTGRMSDRDRQMLDDAVALVDERRTEDLEYMMGIHRRMENADAETTEAMLKLDMIRRSLREIEHRIAKLNSYLSPTSGSPEDLIGLEEQLFYALKDTEQLRPELAGDARGGVERMRAVLERLVDEQVRRRALLENERDELIRDTLLNYESIAQSLENRGPRLSEPFLLEAAKNDLEGVRDLISFRKVQLYAVSGQSREFREAARQCLDAGDAFDVQVRLMESAHFQEKGQLSLAIKAARLALEEAGEDAAGVRVVSEDGTVTWKLTPAQARLKRLEISVLESIAAKTAQDAAFVRKLCEEQIGVHGDKGITGFAYDTVFMGRYISAKGENSIFTSLYDLVTGGQPRWPGSILSGTPLDREDTEAGKPESQAREMGVVLDDASRTVMGLMLIRKLREANVPLEKIRAMSAREFRETTAKALGKEEGDRWHRLTDEQVMKLRSELHFAMRQADVERLMEGKSQLLDLEIGRSYYDTESFEPSLRDSFEDLFSPFSVAMFGLPAAKVGSAASRLSFMQWAHPAKGAAAVPLKYAVAEKIGVSAAMKWATQHPIGARLANDLVDIHSRLWLLPRIAVDRAIDYNLSSIAKFGTEYVVGKLGYDEATQEKAGRVAAFVSGLAATYLTDFDTTVSFAKEALNPSQALAVSNALRSAVRTSNELTAAGDRHERVLQRLLPEMKESGRLSADSQRAARSAAGELQSRIESLHKALPAEADAHGLVNDNVKRLQMLQGSLQAASEGLPEQAKKLSRFADELSVSIRGNRGSVEAQINAIAGAAEAPPHRGATGPNLSAYPRFGDELEFRRLSAAPLADSLLQQGKYKRAANIYEAFYHVYEQLGMTEDKAAKTVLERLRLAKHLDKAEEFFRKMGLNPDVNAHVMNPITDLELSAYKNAPDFALPQILSDSGKPMGASESFWAKAGGRTIGVFKPPHPGFSGGMEAEITVPRLAEPLGVRVAAATKAIFPVPAKVEGTFAVFKAADDAGVPPDWRRLISAPDVEVMRVTGDGPPAYWVSQHGKRVALFVPDSAIGDPNTAGAHLGRIAREAGGETLGVVPKITMKVPEVEGTFVRFLEGKELFQFTDVERIVLKKEIARHWILRLLAGDYDAHARNFIVGPDGKLAGYDWNLADFLEEGKGFSVMDVLGKPAISTSPAEMAADVEKLMRHRLTFIKGHIRGQHPIYQCMAKVADQVTFEDFGDGLRTIQSWDRNVLRARIGTAFGDQTERVLDVLETRIKVMERVLQDSFPPVSVPAATQPRAPATEEPIAFLMDLPFVDADGPLLLQLDLEAEGRGPDGREVHRVPGVLGRPVLAAVFDRDPGPARFVVNAP